MHPRRCMATEEELNRISELIIGAAVAVRLLRAQGGSVDLDGETLRIRLEAAS